MKVTKEYLKRIIKEEMTKLSDTLSPTKKELLAILSQRVGKGMDAELLVRALTDEEAEMLLRQQKTSHKE